MQAHPGPEPQEVQREPDQVGDQQLGPDLEPQRVRRKAEAGEQRRVDGVGLGIEHLQHHRAEHAGWVPGLDEGDPRPGKGDPGGEVEQERRRPGQQQQPQPRRRQQHGGEAAHHRQHDDVRPQHDAEHKHHRAPETIGGTEARHREDGRTGGKDEEKCGEAEADHGAICCAFAARSKRKLNKDGKGRPTAAQDF